MAIATEAQVQVPTIENEPEGLYEVVDGQVVEKPAMGAYEVEIAVILVRLMGVFAETHQLGRVVMEMPFRLKPGGKLDRRPDVAFVSRERWPIERRVPRAAAWDVVPDLAVEVISPNNKAIEVVKRLEEYFRAGVRAVWVVYPDVNKVYLYESPTEVTILAQGEALDGGELLPGFRLDLLELFGEEESLSREEP